jgi:LPS-assembly protein
VLSKVCYFCDLGPPKTSLTLLSTKVRVCQQKSSSNTYVLWFTLFTGLGLVAAAQGQPQSALPVPQAKNLAVGAWEATFVTQEKDGSHHKLIGGAGHPAELQDSRLLFRADEIDYDEETGELRANGNVYYVNFERKTQIWASRMEYNTEGETGKFYDVKGEAHPRIVARPGILSVDAPFHFEGNWAERVGDKYIVHDGWITNCKIPKPWWRLRAHRFDIVPDQHAIAYRSWFFVRKVPLFFAPVYYHSLEKQPRKSGFLAPNLVPHSKRGFMVGLGYYWAISQSYDATYSIQDFTTNAFAHHFDFRARPKKGTELNAVLYGVQDHGDPNSTQKPPPTYSGVDLYLVGKSDLGNGFTARGFVNYISSFRFRQQWSESFTETISSEFHSIGTIDKNWNTYSASLTFSQVQNFQSSEIDFVDPVTGQHRFLSNAITIRKLPEVQFGSRDKRVHKTWPLWFSFDTSASLLHRDEPNFRDNQLVYTFTTGPFTSRIDLAPHLMGAFHLWNFNLVTRAGIEETIYGQGQGIDPTDPTRYRPLGTDLVRSARDFSVDLIFPSFARVFQKKTVFGDRLKHVIEPKATYNYVAGIGQDFSRFIRFDETEILANTSEVELSLTNRIYAKRGDNVDEIFTWELAQKRFFDPTFGGALIPGVRNVFAATADISPYAYLLDPRVYSPVVSRLRISPIPGLGLQWQSEYDPRYHGIVDGMLSLEYRWKVYSVSAQNYEVHTDPLLTPAANQYRFQGGIGNANRRGWNAGGLVAYDARAKEGQPRLQFFMSQVTYNTDCCGISVQYGKFGLRGETLFRIAFGVANLGSFGTLRKQDRMF